MPVNINLLSDEAIARGITPPDVGNFGTALTGTQDYLQKQALQNLFSGGLPHDAQGNVDYKQMAEMLARVQGAGAVPTLASLRQADIQQQALTAAGNLGGVFSPPPQTQPQTSLRPVSALPGESPPTSLSRAGATAPSLAAASRTQDAPLNAYQNSEVPGSAMASVDGGPMTALASGQQEQPATVAARFNAATDNALPPERPQQIAQAQPQQQPRQMPPAPTGTLITNPNQPGYWSLENAANLDRAAARANQASTIMGIGGLAPASPGFLQQGKQLSDQAKQIRDVISAREAPTEQIKNYQAGRLPNETLPQYQARTAGEAEQSKTLGGQFAKKYEAVTEAGSKAETAIPQLQVVQRSTLDPNFYSGFAANRVLLAKQVIGALGGDPNTAAPMQVSESLLSGSILSGLKAIVQGTGQVRSAELGLMRNQAAAPTDSPEAFRTKVEVALRVQQRARDLADMAQNYKGGNLDAGFDRQVSKLPSLFSEAEIKNPKLLAYQKFGSPAEAAAARLPPGTRFRDSNDTIRFIP